MEQEWSYEGIFQIVIALIPEFLIVSVAFDYVVIVRRVFGRER
jgi:hypothetical protein